jgi:hypothetical protein
MTGPAIATAFNDLLDTGDDKIGQVQLVITLKQMVTLTRAPQKDLKGILWQLDSSLISGDGASYESYFSILKA